MPAQSNISRFTVLQRLGTGGMAEVFLCRQSGIGGFGKLVVIKRILPHLVEDASFVSMFLDEARIAANLSHPNIVQVFEIDQDPRGIPYIVMEYVRGPSFAQVIREATARDALHAGCMVRLLEGAAKGLDHAHHAHDAAGRPLHIVHRDVSPHNILVSAEGAAKVADFGIAKADGRLTHTQAGIVKGKVRYTAPEVLEDPEHGAQPCADVFSLGVCAYQALTGQLPFTGADEQAVMAAIHAGGFRKPSELRPGLDGELEGIVCRALERDPAKRTPTARVLADELRAWRLAHLDGTSDAELCAWLARLCPPQPVQLPQEVTGTLAPPALPAAATPSGGPRASDAPEVLDEADLLDDVEVVLTDSGAVRVPSARRGSAVAGVVALVLLLAAAVVAGWSARRQAAETRRQEAELSAFLEEAERQLASGHFARAEELVRTAQGTAGHTPESDIRLAHLLADLRSGKLLAAGRVALESGEPAQAAAAASEVLALEPEDARARALLGEARRALALLDAAADAGVAPEEPTAADDAATRAAKKAALKRAWAERQAKAAESAAVDAGPPALATPAPPPPTPPAAVAPEPLEPPPPVEVPVARVTGHVEHQRAKSDGRPLLQVLSSVRAQVFVDGLPVGHTPLDAREVSADAHLVMVWADGYTSVTERVTVGPGERLTLKFRLLRDPHAPHAASSP